MSCGTLKTGNHFLGGVLAQVDCQAQAIGAYGYGVLADPNSPVASVLLGLLTLFIALFGIRLMFGKAPSGYDLVTDAIKVGIVLTLATSWPAWRTLAYDAVLDGPTQVASIIGSASSLPGSRGDLNQRLDNADQSILTLTACGSGRLTGGVVGSTDLGDSTRGIALADQAGFGWGRVAFLAGTIGPLAVVRLVAGILLALAPLMAGLLLFAGTRDLFMGWLRALGACALGSLTLSLVYAVELSLLEGWLGDALGQREVNVLTPAVPTELLVLALAFAAITWGALGLVVRLMFFASPGWQRFSEALGEQNWFGDRQRPQERLAFAGAPQDHSRAQQISDAVAQSVRREEHHNEMSRRLSQSTLNRGSGSDVPPSRSPRGEEALGNSYRRTRTRNSASATKRDSAP